MKKVLLLMVSMFLVCFLLSCNKTEEEISETHNSVVSKTQIEQALQKVPGVIQYEFVTEETDPNNKLNKDGYYVEKVYFSYALVDQESIDGETLLQKGIYAGGSIEVYESLEDAQRRDEYLKASDGTILYTASHIVYDTCVIRASRELTATQQEVLEKNIIFALKGQYDNIIDTRVQYKIKYYLENTENKFVLEKESTLKEFPKIIVSPTFEEFDNYYLDAELSNTSGKVSADGSLILEAYYKRNRFSIFSNTVGGKITSAQTCFYGQNILLTAEITQIGYGFDGWYSNGKLLSNQISYQCEIQNSIEARFSVLPEMKNFYFESTLTTCKITGVKDNAIESVTIPSYVTDISQGALYFKNLKTLRIDAVKLNDIKLSDESSWLFYNESLQSVKVILGKNVTRIPDNLFRKRMSSDSFYIKEVVFENGSMCESIGQAAFMGQNKLEIVTFGNNSKLRIISPFAFADCKNLKKIDFGTDSILEKIGHDVFNSNKLTEIRIPKNVKTIEVWAIHIGSDATRLTIYCEVSEHNIPSGWHKEWYVCYDNSLVEIKWNNK